MLAHEKRRVIADIEIGLTAVDNAERHGMARLPDARVRPRQFEPALTTAVIGIRRVRPLPGNVMVEVSSPRKGCNKCAREALQMRVGKGEWFMKAPCRSTEAGRISEEEPHIAHVHGAVVCIFGMGAMIWCSAIHVVPTKVSFARRVLVPQIPRVEVVREIALLA